MSRIGLAVAAALVLAGCKPKPAPIVDAGPAPSAASTPSPTEIQALTDAGDDAGPPDAGRHAGGAPGPANPIKACCAAAHGEAKRLGTTSPEGFQMQQFASSCDALSAQVTQGNAPEFYALKQTFKNLKLPAACP
jgi:hypothetical protein